MNTLELKLVAPSVEHEGEASIKAQFENSMRYATAAVKAAITTIDYAKDRYSIDDATALGLSIIYAVKAKLKDLEKGSGERWLNI